jgi:hypothetical protein
MAESGLEFSPHRQASNRRRFIPLMNIWNNFAAMIRRLPSGSRPLLRGVLQAAIDR